MKNNLHFPLQHIVITICIALCSCFFPHLGHTATSSSDLCSDNRWPSEHSEIVPHESLVRGRFDNGLRYVLMRNEQPENRVAIYLNVQAGSLHESENQRGVAHFLEHMMFNGSENFPAGSLVEYFQSLGMGFGGDTNAHTSHTETVYHIVLPGGAEADLDSGLLVLADYARGALLENEEIDRERGVILAERRARDSAAYRSYVAKMAFALRGTRYPERMVIGLPKVLQEADQQLLKKYYDSWYRPENMVVVVVGDFEIELTEKLINRHFARMTSEGEKPECPDFGTLKHKGVETYYQFESELGKINVALESFWQLPLLNDSVQLEKKELLNIIGQLIMNHRIEKLVEEEKVPFVHGRYGAGDIINRIGYGSLSAEVDKFHWKQSLEYLVQLLNQALEYGFTSDELGRVKKEIIAQLDGRILTESSEDSRTIARRIIDHLNNNRVFQSAQQERTLYGTLTSGISLEEVNQAFRALWRHDSRLISVIGDINLGKDAGEKIKGIYKGSQGLAVVQTEPEKSTAFPYLQPGPAGEVEPQSVELPGLDAERLVYPNGLIVNLKQTQFEKNQIHIRADFGAGKLSERHPGSSLLVEEIVNGSGTGQLSQSALETVLAGSSVAMSFNVGDSYFSWIGKSLPGDFELTCQLLYTRLLDPGFKVNIFRKVMSDTELWYQKIDKQVEAFLPLAVRPFLAGYDYHFGLPPWEKVAQLDFAGLSKWAQTFASPNDLEISVVGDFDRRKVVDILNKYFSGLVLQPAQIVAPSVIKFPVGKKLNTPVASSEDKSLIAIAWPVEGAWTIERTRRLHVLADVFGDRLRKIVREEMSASYATRVSNFSSMIYNGYGYLLAHMLVKPGREEEIIKKVMKIAESLREDGVNSEEVMRAIQPTLTALQERIRTNEYWLNSVLSLSMRHPQQLKWPVNVLSDYSNITPSELNSLTEKYLQNEHAAVVRILPSGGNNQK